MSNFSGVFILVEGIRDIDFLKKFTIKSKCRILITRGKENALNLLETLNEYFMNNKKSQEFILIIDRDYDFLLNREILNKRVFYYDKSDLEITMIYQIDFEKFLYCVIPTSFKFLIKDFNSKYTNIKNFILSLSNKIGALRFINDKHSYFLSFKGLNYFDLIEINNLDIILKIETILRSIYIGRTIPDLTLMSNEIQDVIEEINDSFLISNGHDFLNILIKILMDVFGCQNKSEDFYFKNLLENFTKNDLFSLNIFNSISKWVLDTKFPVFIDLK
jgi:hypothetical protein